MLVFKEFIPIFLGNTFFWIIFFEEFPKLCVGKWRTNIGAEVIDNNLPFFLSFFRIEGAISEPFIDQTHKGIDTTQTNSSFLVSKLFYSCGITTTPFRIHLAGMVLLVLFLF